MDANTRELVRQQAGNACEYCRIPQEATPAISFHVEHTIAKQHGAGDDPNLLALARDRCMAYKWPTLASIDPDTGDLVPLFNPRQDAWANHFALRGGEIVGLTGTGRATVRLLNMNSPRRAELREEWLDEGGAIS